MTANPVERAWGQQRKKLQQPSTLALLTRYKLHPTIRLRNQIAKLNLGLVANEAKRWADQCSVPLEDLKQEGVFGLLKAIDAYDPATGHAFSSVAVPYITGAIQHFLRDKGWADSGMVRPPRRAVETYAKVKKAQRILTAQGRELPAVEVAAGLGISAAKWRFVEEAREQKPVLSLDEEPLHLAADGPEVADDLSWVMGHLEGLGEPARSCVVERVFGQLSDEAIAARHSLAVTSVRLLIESGLEQMRAEIIAEGRMG